MSKMNLSPKELERRRKMAPFNDPEVRARAIAKATATRDAMTPEQKEERRVANLLKLQKAREARKERHNEKMAEVADRLRLMVERSGSVWDRIADKERAKFKNKDIQGR